MNHTRFLPLMLISIFVLFLAGNHLAGNALSRIRVDLTQNGLYQLSPGSQEIIDQLNEPIEWQFYHSRSEAIEYPAIRAYASRVREFLQAYADHSSGNIRLSEIDPAPFSEQEDDALESGLIPLSTQTGERLFFGLVGRNSIDEQIVIPLFNEEDEVRLEYDLTRLISDLEREERPRLSILTSLPISPESGEPNHFIAELSAAYELIWIEHDFEDLPATSSLLIMHPGALSQEQLYRIDQFVLQQGRAIIFLDPLAHMAMRPGFDGLPPVNARRGSDLGSLTTHWGIAWDSETVAMDRLLGLPVEIQGADGRSRRRAYPLWFSIGPQQMDREDLATASLDLGVNFGSPGALFALPGSGIRFTPLMTTSEEGALIDAGIAAGAPGPDDLLRDYQREEDPIVIAARLTGLIETAFPDGPPAGDIVFEPGQHRNSSSQPANLMIVADIDWLDDTYYVRNDPTTGINLVADNLTVAMNFIDMAVGDPALVSLRSRSLSNRPMIRVDNLRSEAETRYVEIQNQLEAELDDAEERLQVLQGSGSTSALFAQNNVDAHQEAQLLRHQIADTRTRLREIEREFRSDIDALDANLQFWTIGVPPALVILVGLAGTLVRRRRRAS